MISDSMAVDPSADPAQRRPARWIAVITATVLSAALYYVSAGLGRLWPAIWFAPLPVLILAFRSSRRIVFLAAFGAYFGGSLNLFEYLRQIVPLPVLLLGLGLPSVFFGIAVLAARYAVNKIDSWLAVLMFPCAWTTYEFLLSLISPNGTILSLAYTQTDFLPLLQIVSITGIWAVTFLVCLVPAALAVAWHRRSAQPLVPAALLLCVVLAYGLARLHTGAPAGTAVRVGLAATDEGIAQAFATQDPSIAARVAGEYAQRVRRLGAEGAQLILLPEKLVGVTPVDAAAVETPLADAARSEKAFVIAGLNHVGSRPLRNVAAIFSDEGKRLAEYEKRHMLPGAEDGYKVGNDPAIFRIGGTLWGVAICKDLDFPAWLREYGRRDVRILAVPAWDFGVDGRLHSRMAVVRGVENGFSLARTAQQGLLTVSDAYGRILGETVSSDAATAYLIRNVPPGPGATPYTKMSDWFGWLTLVLLIVLLSFRRFGNLFTKRRFSP